MRIAFVSSTYDRHHRRRNSLFENLIKAGHDVQLFALNLNNGAVNFPSHAICIDRSDFTGIFWDARKAAAAVREQAVQAISVFKPDCIVCMEPESLFVAIYFKQHASVRVIYDVQEFHGRTTGSGFLRRLWVLREERRAMPYIDAISVLSDIMGANFRRIHSRLPPVHILSNALPVQENLQYSGYLHEKSGVPHATKILLYLGYLTRDRGLEWLARLAPQLPVGWHTVMMGWGEMEPVLRTMQSERLSIIPAVEPDELLSAVCGACIGTILYDNTSLNHANSTPNKLYEYPAAGVPIWSEDLPELAKIIEQHDIGWIMPKSTPIGRVLDLFDERRSRERHRKALNTHAFTALQRGDMLGELWRAIIEG